MITYQLYSPEHADVKITITGTMLYEALERRSGRDGIKRPAVYRYVRRMLSETLQRFSAAYSDERSFPLNSDIDRILDNILFLASGKHYEKVLEEVTNGTERSRRVN